MTASKIVIIVGVLSCFALAQDAPIYLEITLNQGYVFEGQFVSETDTTLVIINDSNNLVTLKKNLISSQQNISERVLAELAAIATANREALSNPKVDQFRWAVGFGRGHGEQFSMTLQLASGFPDASGLRAVITIGSLTLEREHQRIVGNSLWDESAMLLKQASQPTPRGAIFAPYYFVTEPGLFAMLEIQNHRVVGDLDWVIMGSFGATFLDRIIDSNNYVYPGNALKMVSAATQLRYKSVYVEFRKYFPRHKYYTYRSNLLTFGIQLAPHQSKLLDGAILGLGYTFIAMLTILRGAS